MRILTIGKNDAGQRVDKFIRKTFENMPQSMMYKFIRTKKIKVNRKRAEISQMLCEGDTVELFVPEDFLVQGQKDDFYKNIVPTFGIVYEDDNIIICNKPVGLLSHSDTDGEQNTLIEQVKSYLWKKGEYDPDAENSFAPALCNRIDRNTGGIVTAAKNAEALRDMNERIRVRSVSKYYVCMVHGRMEQKEATLTGYLTKDGDTNTVSVSKVPQKGHEREQKKIVTKYRVTDYDGHDSTLEIELVTGRTHQIRAHMASVGHPLIGDGKYAENKKDRARGYSHQALYSYRLVFGQGDDALSYLNGREFSLSRDEIPFLKK
ncbi:MAG: RluA family pseudouridine synthase [Clostridia bacterium]|nr:RluA family pseudouridine synthase [Clostridia bacterium]